ncbi:MAG: DUF4340 domain-containing protein [Bacteroidota bacterium]
MQRIYALAGIVVILAIALGFFYYSDGDSAKGTRLGEDRDFKVAELEAISKVFISDRAGNATTLTKSGDAWMVNDQYPANSSAMENLMQAVEQIEMQYIPANKAIPNIVKNLATEGIHVEIFAAGDRKIKGYYIGGSTADERGTFAIMEGAEQPYVVHIPGWVGNVRFRYNLVGDDWRSKILFQENLANIDLVSIEYPTQRNKSFVLERGSDGYAIGPFYETGQPTRKLSVGRAEQYLSAYESVYLSAYANHAVQEKAELLRRNPFATLRISRSDGSETSIKLFPRLNSEYEAADPNTDAFVSQVQEAGWNLLLNDDADFVTASSQMIQPLLVSYTSF